MRQITIVHVFSFLSGMLPEGLVHELPSADTFQIQPPSEETGNNVVDDLEDLRRQLDALNAP